MGRLLLFLGLAGLLLPWLACRAHDLGALQPNGRQETDSTTAFIQLDSQQKADPTPKKIQGKIKLNGVFFQTLCECADSTSDSSCHNPVKWRVHQEAYNAKMGLSMEDLKDLLGSPGSLPMIDAAKTSFAGIDGRERRAILATPGGDFGEFLLALGVYESIVGLQFAQATIQGMLSNYLSQRLLPLYFATDEDALRSVADHLHVNGQTHVVVGLDLTNPDDLYKASLLEDLVKPQNAGDYFLKTVLSNPARFYMRPQLVHDCVRALYSILWDKQTLGTDGVVLSSKINFVVLEGKPQEKAWINFRGNVPCELEDKAPAFVPRHGNVQVFVNHPQAIRALRRRLARFFFAQPTKSAMEISENDLFLRINRQGKRVMEVMAEVFGLHVPFYTVIAQ